MHIQVTGMRLLRQTIVKTPGKASRGIVAALGQAQKKRPKPYGALRIIL
jgi:hypothetical protein